MCNRGLVKQAFILRQYKFILRAHKVILELTVLNRRSLNRNEKMVGQWFRLKAEYHSIQALDRVYPLLAKYNVGKPHIEIRSMKARWGSCIRDKHKILLNTELIKAPKYCIDYVVLHELIHFRYRDHNADFYGFLNSLMPDWIEDGKGAVQFALSNYEKGKRRIYLSQLEKLAEVLEKPFEYFLAGGEPEEGPAATDWNADWL